jgi:hypothetical protein
MATTAQAKIAAIRPEYGPSKNSAAHAHANNTNKIGARRIQRRIVFMGR